MNLYKKCPEKPYSFLVIDTTLASILLVLETVVGIVLLKMKNYNMILTENVINICQKCHYLLEKKINMNISQVKKYFAKQKQIIEQATFGYSHLGKTISFRENKQKQLKIRAKSKYKQLKIMESNWLNLMN